MFKVYLNGKEVALILRIRKMTQKELAEKSGLSCVHISRLINLQSPVGITAQKSLQNALKFIPFERMFTMVDKI
jgi:transcriptional regulator with XRE-family HTH domain